MTLAILQATNRARDAETPSALLKLPGGSTLIGDLAGRFRSAGVNRIVAITRPEWVDAIGAAVGDGVEVRGSASLATDIEAYAELFGESDGDTLISEADVVCHHGAISGLLLDPKITSGTLASRAKRYAGLNRITIQRGRVIHARSAYHTSPRTNSHALGMIKVGADDREAAIEACRIVSDPAFADSPSLQAELDATSHRRLNTFARSNQGLMLQRELAERRHDLEWLPDRDTIEAELDGALEEAVVRPREEDERDPAALVLVGLVRSGTLVKPAYLRSFQLHRCRTQDEAERAGTALARADEDAIALSNAVKATDGFFTTFFVSPYSRFIARWTAKRGMTPNQVTWISLALGALAALAFWRATLEWRIVGAVLLQAAFTFDCVDGQLARYTRQFSRLGAWLDSVFDRGKEYLVFAGLAAGYERLNPGSDIWLLAMAAIGFQTFRHLVDFSYAAQQHEELDELDYLPMVEAHPLNAYVADDESDDDDPDAAPEAVEEIVVTPRASLMSSIARSVIKLSRQAADLPGGVWLKRIITLPIGERFFLISITAAIWGAKVTFISLLVWGAFAALYVSTGRVVRSLR